MHPDVLQWHQVSYMLKRRTAQALQLVHAYCLELHPTLQIWQVATKGLWRIIEHAISGLKACSSKAFMQRAAHVCAQQYTFAIIVCLKRHNCGARLEANGASNSLLCPGQPAQP